MTQIYFKSNYLKGKKCRLVFCFIAITNIRSNIVKMIMFRNMALVITTLSFFCPGCDSNSPEIPRIDFVEMSDKQPHENDPDSLAPAI